jgi:Papain family cysteine protease
MRFNIMTKMSCAAIILAQLASCGQPLKKSTIESVDIGQTPVKSQGRVGFCWAYATIGFLESLMVKKTGVSVDLSEEALGFYRMAEELYAISRKYEATDLADEDKISRIVFEGLEGWDVTFNPAYNPNLPVRNALQLIEAYGAVPESAWSFKFTSDEQLEAFTKVVFSSFADLMRVNGRGQVTREMVFGLLAKQGAYGSRPPEQFTYLSPNGSSRTVSAVNFVSDIIGFSKDDYTYLIPDAQIGYSQLVSAMKLSLARGLNIPFSYAIFKDQFNRWDASYAVLSPSTQPIEIVGGHAVLVTDFVNNGGRPGSISPDALSRELAKSPDDLQYVVIKNSWGTDLQSPLLLLPGFHTIYQSYLRELAKKETTIAIVVPRDIAFQVRYN